MKTCVSSYSFSRLQGDEKLTQLQLIAKVKEMGFDAIEFTDLKTPEGMTDLEYAAALRAEAEKHSLPIANYTIGADLLNNDLDTEVERLCRKVDVAAALGAKGMRHDATGGYKDERASYLGFGDALPRLAEGCRRVTEYAASKGVATMVENHGYFCQDSERVERLVNAVANPNFGLLVDIGNFLCADDPSALAVGRVARYAKHVHCKDFHVKCGAGDDPGSEFFKSRAGNYLRGAILGHGNVSVRQCLNILKSANYDGYVSIEFEGIEPPLKAIAIGLDNLKRYIGN